MKHLLSAATLLAASTFYASCFPAPDAEDIDPNPTEERTDMKAFTFHVKGDFSVSFEDMTRAAVRLEDNNTAAITDIWVLDYDQQGTLLQQVHQTSTQQGITFGSVTMTLTYGHHDIKFVASKGTTPNVTDGVISWAKVLDTFCLDYPIDVTASSNGNRAPELKRAIGGVKVVAADAVANGTHKVSVTMKRSLSLSLPTLVASEATASANEFSITSSQWYKTGLALTTYTLCDEELTTDVVVTVTGADDAVISQFTVKDVSVKKNRITTLTGEVFGRGEGFSVMIDDGWDEGVEVKF